MFRYCSEEKLRQLIPLMKLNHLKQGDVLIKEGEPTKTLFLIQSGIIRRERFLNGQLHVIDDGTKRSYNGLHCIRNDPCYATTTCLTDVVAYSLDSEDIKKILLKDPDLMMESLYSVAMEVRTISKNLRTPLLEQHAKQTPYFATSIAAGVESFYRSALNSILNARLKGIRGSLFPNMHVQLPTRIIYINGFKGLRFYLEQHVDASQYTFPNAVRLLEAVTPGVIMTPVSSILEACNAGHLNPEPLYYRWIRGIFPRALREVIFGVGLNQLSDYCEERVPFVQNPTFRNALGSMMAGVISGYLSHVPHILSTLKLMEPSKSYRHHFDSVVKSQNEYMSQHIIFGNSWKNLPQRLQYFGSSVTSCVFPKGCLIRTTQIVGSFMILNGTINALQSFPPNKKLKDNDSNSE